MSDAMNVPKVITQFKAGIWIPDIAEAERCRCDDVENAIRAYVIGIDDGMLKATRLFPLPAPHAQRDPAPVDPWLDFLTLCEEALKSGEYYKRPYITYALHPRARSAIRNAIMDSKLKPAVLAKWKPMEWRQIRDVGEITCRHIAENIEAIRNQR